MLGTRSPGTAPSEALVEPLLDARQVVGVDAGDPRVDVAGDLLRAKTAHLGPARVEDHLAGPDVPVPGGEVGALERELDPLLRLAKLVLGPLALADVANEPLPAAVGEDLGAHLDGHVRAVLAAQVPLRDVDLPAQQLLLRLPQRGIVRGRQQIDDGLADDLVARVRRATGSPRR